MTYTFYISLLITFSFVLMNVDWLLGNKLAKTPSDIVITNWIMLIIISWMITVAVADLRK